MRVTFDRRNPQMFWEYVYSPFLLALFYLTSVKCLWVPSATQTDCITLDWHCPPHIPPTHGRPGISDPALAETKPEHFNPLRSESWVSTVATSNPLGNSFLIERIETPIASVIFLQKVMFHFTLCQDVLLLSLCTVQMWLIPPWSRRSPALALRHLASRRELLSV